MSDSVSAVPKAAQRLEVLNAIKSASAATGADFSYLVRTAQRESNFDPTAKASTSSATGLFQFTNETWLNVLDRYGAQHNVSTEGQSRADLLALRNDPDLSARMAGELARENSRILEKKLGRPATSSELYVAHFMGPQEAAHLIRAARHNSKGSAAEMFPRAALANTSVFSGKDGENITPSQLYTKLTGVAVADADAGKVAPGNFADPHAHMTPPDAQMLLNARLGATQLATTLMSALFDFQTDSLTASNWPGVNTKT
ncbi:MAG TPA: transglycosylase SLT domain-containing protein [Hyphomonadaceae bacterium]|nr:transglycosylase SLT domain-containing protein [Hyphomonadaceae bacterium]